MVAFKAVTSVVKSTSVDFAFCCSVETLAWKLINLDPIELALPLTTEIFFSTLAISSGVATGVSLTIWSVSSRVFIYPLNLFSRYLSLASLVSSSELIADEMS